jgi:phage gp46-like protein
MVTYHVKISGNDVTGTGTESNPWRTITYGLSQCAAGGAAFDSSADELLVWYDATTPYAESIVFPGGGKTGLVAYGVDSSGVRADAAGWNRDEMVWVQPVAAPGVQFDDWCHLRGFALDGVNAGANNGIAGLGAAAKIHWLEDCEAHDFNGKGATNHGAGSINERVEVYGCTGIGIDAVAAINIELSSCLVYDCDGARGIQANGVGTVAEHCTVAGCGSGGAGIGIDILGGTARNCISLDNMVTYGIRAATIVACCVHTSDPLTYHTLANFFALPADGTSHDAAPVLDVDYRPLVGSPCREAGSTTATTAFDLTGFGFRPLPSMGALEFVGVGDVGAGDEQQVRWSASATGEPVRSDAAYQPFQLDRDALRSAVLASWFSDARAASDDEIPDGRSRRGWWADTQTGDNFGSRLWLLHRAPVTDETVARVEQYCSEALDWMLTENVATDFSVTAERTGTYRISATVTIDRDERESLTLEFSDLWRDLYA